MNATGERKFAGVTQFVMGIEIVQVLFGGQVRYFNIRTYYKFFLALRCLFFCLAGGGLTPLFRAFTLVLLHAFPPFACHWHYSIWEEDMV